MSWTVSCPWCVSQFRPLLDCPFSPSLIHLSPWISSRQNTFVPKAFVGSLLSLSLHWETTLPHEVVLHAPHPLLLWVSDKSHSHRHLGSSPIRSLRDFLKIIKQNEIYLRLVPPSATSWVLGMQAPTVYCTYFMLGLKPTVSCMLPNLPFSIF